MIPPIESNQPVSERPSTAYGAYDGNRGSTQQQYGTPYQQPPQGGTIDDNLVEAMSQRIAQLMSQKSTGKVYAPRSQDKPPHGMQLALGIVSVLVIIALAGVCLGALGGVEGLAAFLIGCLAIVWIDLAFFGVLDTWRH